MDFESAESVLILGAIALVVIVALFVVVFIFFANRRSKAIQGLGRTLDLVFEDYPDDGYGIVSQLEGSHLASLAESYYLDHPSSDSSVYVDDLGDANEPDEFHDPSASNILTGNFGTTRMTFFDYSYGYWIGRKWRTTERTVAVFRDPNLDLPEFHLAPEGFLDKVFNSSKDIDFRSYPDFSSKYILSGEDEEKVRALFFQGPLEFFSRNYDLEVEAEDDRVIFIWPRGLVRTSKVQNFIDTGLKVVEALSRRR